MWVEELELVKVTTQDRAACGINHAHSSEDEFLFRFAEGRDVIPRMESRMESGSNRFGALADPESVPAGTQEVEVVGFGDCVRVPETLDAVEEEATQSSIGVGGWRFPDTIGSRGHTAGERHTVHSTPDRSDICGHDRKNDSDAENPPEAHGVTGIPDDG